MKAVTISPTSVTPTWTKNTTASNSMGGIKSTNENPQMSFANQTGDNSTDPGPGSNGTSGDTTAGKMGGSQGWSWTVLLILYLRALPISSCLLERDWFLLTVEDEEKFCVVHAQEFRWQDHLILRSCVFWDILTASNCLVFKKIFHYYWWILTFLRRLGNRDLVRNVFWCCQ